jgi:N-acetylneuraminic acid mutarotase
MNYARAAHTASVLTDGKVLVTGGFHVNSEMKLNSSELYDPLTEKWTTTNSMKNSRAAHTASVLTNGNVLVTGGYGADQPYLDSAEVYVLSKETSKTIDQMEKIRKESVLPDGHKNNI